MEIKSQDVLEDMINIKDRFVRTVVASRISDPDILEEVILTAKYSDARRIAYDQLGREENVFAEIAKFDRKSANRNRALDEISDEVILLDIAINANDKKIRLKSTEKIENNEVLAELLKNTDDKEIINKIITKEGFNDQEILSRIAANHWTRLMMMNYSRK